MSGILKTQPCHSAGYNRLFMRPSGIISDRPSLHRSHRLTELEVRKGRFISGQLCLCSPPTSDDHTSIDVPVFAIGLLTRWRRRFPVHHSSECQEEAVEWNNNPKKNSILVWSLETTLNNIRAKLKSRRVKPVFLQRNKQGYFRNELFTVIICRCRLQIP